MPLASPPAPYDDRTRVCVRGAVVGGAVVGGYLEACLSREVGFAHTRSIAQSTAGNT